MTGKNVYTMTAMTRRAFVGLAVMAAQAGLRGCVRNVGRRTPAPPTTAPGSRAMPAPRRRSRRSSPPRRPWTASSPPRVTIEEGTGPDGKPFYIRVAYTFENVTDSDTVAPYTDINDQDGIKLDRSYKVQDYGRRSRSSRAEIEVVHGVRPRF